MTKPNPTISFIVSSCNRANMLESCLVSLRNQTHGSYDVHVADNSTEATQRTVIRTYCYEYNAKYYPTYKSPSINQSCYLTASHLAEKVKGEWLCFPSDDSYYVTGFVHTVISDMRLHPDWDVIIFDALYDPRLIGSYDVLRAIPRLRFIDKTMFLIRRSLFAKYNYKFPQHVNDYRDGALIEKLEKDGVRIGKSIGVLTVHN